MAFETLAVSLIVFSVLGIFALVVLFFAFWVWMLVDCAQRKFKNDTDKVVWILVIVLTGWLGALIYYLVVKINKEIP